MISQRMLAIDVLRGMTIFFMIIVNTPGSWEYVWGPLLHAKWHGCTPTDLVFPSFLMVIGLSMAFSFNHTDLSNHSKIINRIIKRVAVIFFIGIFLNWFPFYHKHFSDLRYFGVLQRIALAYFLSGMTVVLLKRKSAIIIATVMLMVVHWIILVMFGDGDPFSLEKNIGGQVDLFLFGSAHIYGGFGIPFDPEGSLGTLSSASQILIGYLIASQWIVKANITYKMIKKIALLAFSLLLLGLIAHPFYPINKPIWTGSYVLYTSGILGLLLSFLIWTIDIMKFDKWTLPFKVFGFNSLVSFVASGLLVKTFLYILRFEDGNLYSLSYKEFFQPIFGNYLGSFVFAITCALIVWLPAFGLYRRNISIKL